MMARPTWNAIPDSDIDLDSPGKTQDVFQYIRDNISAARIIIFGVDLAEDTTSSTSWDTHIGSAYIHVPDVADYSGIQRVVYVPIEVKISGGATGSYRLKDLATSTVGGTETTTSATYEVVTLELDIDASWKGTDRTLKLEFQSSDGGEVAFAKCEYRIDARMEY